MIVYIVYRSPDAEPNDFVETMENIHNSGIDQQDLMKDCFVIAVGDFNLKEIKWKTTGLLEMWNDSCLGTQVNVLLKFMNKNMLSQMVNKPTREASILDLVLTNNKTNIISISQEVNSILSDHNSIYIRSKIYPDQAKAQSMRKDYYFTDLH